MGCVYSSTLTGLCTLSVDGNPFPMVWNKYTIDETRDIGYSSKIISFEIKELE